MLLLATRKLMGKIVFATMKIEAFKDTAGDFETSSLAVTSVD